MSVISEIKSEPKWAYLKATLNTSTNEELTDQLNEHGQMGWELVAIETLTSERCAMLFKKRTQ